MPVKTKFKTKWENKMIYEKLLVSRIVEVIIVSKTGQTWCGTYVDNSFYNYKNKACVWFA